MDKNIKLENILLTDIFKYLSSIGFSQSDVISTINNGENVCVCCGCSDYKACQNICWWEEVDEASGFGICSNCVEKVEGTYGNND